MQNAQDHYLKELKPVPLTKLQRSEPTVGCDDQLRSSLLSLVGGMGWTVNTRWDIAVYLAKLQRQQQKPTVEDVMLANRVLKLLKAKPCVVTFNAAT